MFYVHAPSLLNLIGLPRSSAPRALIEARARIVYMCTNMYMYIYMYNNKSPILEVCAKTDQAVTRIIDLC